MTKLQKNKKHTEKESSQKTKRKALTIIKKEGKK